MSYLTMFERLMVAFEVTCKRERWASKLASHLSGKAQKTYICMQLYLLRKRETTTDSKKQSYGDTISLMKVIARDFGV